MSDKLDEFYRIFKGHVNKGVETSTLWAVVKSVDWENKTMVATSIVDGLDFFDVLLGIGSIYKKPKVNTKCLLGVIGTKAPATFLIEAESIEEIIHISKKSEFVIKEDGFIVKQGDESLKDILNDFIDEVNKIVVLQGNTINVAAVTKIKQRLNKVLK